MEERAIVEALCQRDPAGLAAAYDQYAPRLFDYCAGLLHDRDAAGDAVHDALLAAAAKAHQLRDPDRLRAWLYAIARNECLRQLTRGNRLAPLEKAGDVADENVNVERGVAAEQAQALVRDALGGLNERDREVLDLALRHELSGAELAGALGVSANHAHALLSRAKDQLERSVGALLTARAGQDDCAELAGILASWDGEFTPLVRKRVSRHVDKCGVCGIRKAHEVRAEALFAALPFLVVPALLRRRVLESNEDLEKVSYQGRIAEPFDKSGFPVPLGKRRSRPRLLAWLSAAAVLALLFSWGAVAALRPGPGASVAEKSAIQTPSPDRSPDPSPVGVAALPSPSASPSPSALPSVLPSVVPTRRIAPQQPPATVPSPRISPAAPPSPSPKPSPSPSPAPPPLVVGPPSLTGPGCSSFATWDGTARVTVTPAQPVPSVVFVWSAKGVPEQSVTLGPARGGGGVFAGTIPGLPTGNPVTFHVVATAGKRSAKSDPVPAVTVPFCIIG
ncbi:MAG: hypothetical protein QOJ50_1678 [Cryptosporangiaceae bacterium]|nr:hypothetical protein [Cryptosporangiaceae bacterium]